MIESQHRKSKERGIEDFWNLDAIGIKELMEDSDGQKAMERFEEWLQFSESEWPEGNLPNVKPEVLQEVDTETKGEDTMYRLSRFAGEDSSERQEENVENLQPHFGLKVENFSSLTRLLRVTAYAFRFVDKILRRNNENGVLKS